MKLSVVCPSHGLQALSPREYRAQEYACEDVWRCPVCRQEARATFIPAQGLLGERCLQCREALPEKPIWSEQFICHFCDAICEGIHREKVMGSLRKDLKR